MSTARRALLAVSLAAPLALASCGKAKSLESTNPPITSVPAAADQQDASPTMVEPAPAAEKIVVAASIEGLDDILAMVKKFSESWVPDSAMDPQSELQATLLGLGFGPGFLSNLDLGGVHALTTAAPADGGRPEDTTFAASVAVVDVRKLIENMPQAQRPAPLGDGMWEMQMDGSRLLMRDGGKELLLGLSTQDIDAAGKLRGQIQPGRRFRVRASNLPADDIDPMAVLDFLPPDSKLVRDLSAVLQELEAVWFEADMGTTRDFQAVAAATAPFERLGLDPIGTARAAATPLEGRLPADPVFVTTLSWGDPTLLHKMVDTVPIAQVPDPLQPMVTKTITSAHALLDQVATDVVLALYLDGKNQATFVLAADVHDAAKAKAGLRGLQEVILEAVKTQAAMAGKNKDSALAVEHEVDGLKVGKLAADRLTITIPKAFESDVQPARSFLGKKNNVDMISLVEEGTAVLAIGAGGRALVADVAKSLGKPRRRSLAQDAGLEGVRKSMGGCQICMSGDPLAALTMSLVVVRDGAEDKAVIKAADAKIKQASKARSLGRPSLGLKLAQGEGSIGVFVPQSFVFAPASATKMLGELSDFIDDPESAIEAPASK